MPEGSLPNTPRRVDEVDAALRALNDLYRTSPFNARLAGARAAADWTTGAEHITPVTGQALAPDDAAIAHEGQEAVLIAEGVNPGEQDYGRGAEEWIFWWRGLEPLPAWITI